MFNYYLSLGFRSLRRNVVITGLMILAIGAGIGASMTMLTTLLAMSRDPIPDKSSHLFVPQLDIRGGATRTGNLNMLPFGLTYRDATAFMGARLGERQTEMYPLVMNGIPEHGDSFEVAGRATYRDFFSMFDAPFRSGTAWDVASDTEARNVVVLSAKLARHLFPQGNAVGSTVNLGGRDYQITGVLGNWNPTPRFYDVNSADFGSNGFSEPEDFYLPFSVAINRQIDTTGNSGCEATSNSSDWTIHLNSDCAWVQFWTELDTPSQVRSFTAFLQNYAVDQQTSGRFQWRPMVTIHDVMSWLDFRHVVPNQTRVNSIIAAAFLVVCVINAIGLLLAKFAGRAADFGVRRALGGSRASIFNQCIVEAAIVGLLGGVLGLALTAVGLWGARLLRGATDPDSVSARLVTLNVEIVLITFAVAVVATTFAGLYPAFRASRVQPARLIRSQ